jgi:hypothetical protein
MMPATHPAARRTAGSGGSAGRDFGIDWLDAYVEVKSICIRH